MGAHLNHIYVMTTAGDDPSGAPDPDQFADDRATVKGAFWTKVRQTVGRVPFLEDAITGYYCTTDVATPVAVKALLFGALAYFIVPTDMIPDFIVGLGLADDASVLLAALSTAGRHITAVHRRKAKTFLDETLRDAEDG